MKILVVNGACLQVNSSANLCHLAYVRGLVDAGHEVTVLSADGKYYNLDPSMRLPEGIKLYMYDGTSLYEKLSLKKQTKKNSNEKTTQVQKTDLSVKQRIIKRVKSAALNVYGIHGIYAKFVQKAMAFHSQEIYDYMISLSTPVTSHLLAYKLRASKRVKCHHWIQIWEDPWYSDAYGFNNREAVFKEEKRLLSYAERVCYVSPITLENQKKLFPESAEKMFWQPLPAYYKQESSQKTETIDSITMGYFGAYYPATRDLEPFYRAACKTGKEVFICGEPSSLFAATETVHIQPRLPLEQLKRFEDKTNVLVFLCNRKGGQIPGKIYQYAATDKTILFILDGTEEEKRVLYNYFAPFERFVFCENSVESIEKAIERIARGDLKSVRNRPLTEFEPERIVQRILEEGLIERNAQ